MYCDHCQTTVVVDANFCPFCGGKTSEAPGADAVDLSQAPTVALSIGPCESCGAPSLPGSTLCLPCTRAFESILNTQPATPVPAPVASATAAVDAAALDEPLADDEEYVDDDEADDLMGEEAATVLMTAPPVEAAPPALAVTATDAMDWSTPSTSSGEHKAIVALPAWARKGPDADGDPATDVAPAATPAEAPGAEPVPWWERNGQQGPTAASAGKPEVARYVPPPSAAAPASATLESTVARQAMRPKSTPVPATAPVAVRPSASNRSRTMVIAAACAGVAAIGTPVMWKLAFASRPNTVSALQMDAIAAAPEPDAPRPERVHGQPPPAASTRVYQDLQPTAPEPTAAVTPAAPTATHAATPKPKKPAVVAVVPEPVAVAVVAPEPAPLLVSTPTPVATAPTAAAAPPASVQAEAVPLGQIYEISQVESRPAVTHRFDPVLPARIDATSTVVVIVRVLVSPSGRAVESSSVKNPTNDAGVASAAAATVRQWTFAPAKKKGQAVSCWLNVGVVFKSASGN